MSLYLLESSQSISVNAPPVADISVNGKRYLTSVEDGTPTAFEWDDVAVVTAGGEPITLGSTALRVESPIAIATDVTSSAQGFSLSGSQDPIDAMTVNGNVLDFTAYVNSLSDVEADTGLTLTLSGFSSESEAFNLVATSVLLDLLDTKHFTLVKDKSVQMFSGRSNREIFKFKMDENDTNIVTDAGNHIDFEQPGIVKVEILGNNEDKIDSTTSAIKLSGSELLVRLGDLDIPAASSMTLTFILYVEGDDKGIVLTTSETLPNTTAMVYRPSLQSS